MNRTTTARLAALLLLPALLASCSTVPITGRRQVNLFSSAEMTGMSLKAYGEFLSKHKLSDNVAQTRMVKRVGYRIQKAVEEFFARRNDVDRLKEFHWEFNLIESKDVNAWCMPGGKVAVYTGILPVTQTEEGLAVVMGHEIAHAIANHGNERMSQRLFAAGGAAVLNEALANKPKETRDLFLTVFGAGAAIGFLLPYSRIHESEADRLGVIFMAMAGYDPREAPRFWKRMAAMSKGGRAPEFLSTHPAHETRIKNLARLVSEEAMKYYRPRP